MADAKNPYAQVIIDQLGSQIDLGTTLATAIIGGMVALLTQIALHNASRTGRPLLLQARWLIVAVFACEVLSLLAGYAARGLVTGVTPILLQLAETAWSPDGVPASFTKIQFRHACELRLAMGAQLLSLVAGIALVCWFAITNRSRLL